MTEDEFDKLDRGDIIKGKFSGNAYVVDAKYGPRNITAVIHISNPGEWELAAPLRSSLEKYKSKRPVAFIVRNKAGQNLIVTLNEGVASELADSLGVDYHGLYERN